MLVGNLGLFPCVGNDYGWFFLGFCGSRYQGGVVIFFFGGVSVEFCQSVWHRNDELVST